MSRNWALLCSEDDVISVLSNQGVLYSIDDDRTGERSTVSVQFITDAIERSSVKIRAFLSQWYDLGTLAGNTWLKWACATFTAVNLMRRRGDTAPDGLMAEYQEYADFLVKVNDNEAIIPSDNGTDAQLLTQNAGVTMSNLRIDHRYPYSQIRAIARTSVGDQRSKLVRNMDYPSTIFLE